MQICYHSGAVRNLVESVKAGETKVNPDALRLMRATLHQDGVDPETLLLCSMRELSRAILTGEMPSAGREDYRDLFMTLLYAWFVAKEEVAAEEFDKWMSAPAYEGKERD